MSSYFTTTEEHGWILKYSEFGNQPKMPEAEKGINSDAYQELH